MATLAEATPPGASPAANSSSDTSFDPRTGAARTVVPHTPPAEVAAIMQRAAAAAPVLARSSPALRREWILAIVATISEHADRLVQIADAETALGSPRLPGELAKALENAKFYADVAVEGGYFAATRNETAVPSTRSSERKGNHIQLARVNVPRGPVMVYGASNFPFQFGVFGHDTASALSSGCPVVAKAHPAHPELSAALGDLVSEALRSVGAPEGTFALISGFDAGLQAVDHDAVAAVAFTGSQRGGMALVERLAARGVPVFAEMGTVNPAIALPGSDLNEVLVGFLNSFTLGAGQFCTKPGLLMVPRGSNAFDGLTKLATALPTQVLLTEGIAHAYTDGLQRLETAGAVLSANSVASTVTTKSSATGPSLPASFEVEVRVGEVSLDQLKRGSNLLEECFGPVALVAEYDQVSDAIEALGRLQPSLAGSVFQGDIAADLCAAIDVLAAQTGRVCIDQWPTGVACNESQNHGGPWPATSRGEATSVGASALVRFVRSVAFQNLDASAAELILPGALRPSNPWNVPQRVINT